MTASRRTATGTILRAVSDQPAMTTEACIDDLRAVIMHDLYGVTREQYAEAAAQADAASAVPVPAAPVPAAPAEPAGPDYGDRDVAIAAIKAALKRRSNKAWSVTGGKGTSWGWITITAPPKRRNDYGSMTQDDEDELRDLLGLDQAHHQGVTIPASGAYRREYVARAQGRAPEVTGTPYWD